MKEKTTTDLISHIEKERGRCASARKLLLDDIEKWYKTFEMDNTSLKRQVPFEGASSAFQPLLFEEAKLLYGKLWAMQFKHRPLLSTEPKALNPPEAIIEAVGEVERSMDQILYREIEVRRKLMPITLEGLLLGAGVVFIPYKLQTRQVPIYTPGQDTPTLLPTVTYASADMEYCPLAHCEWPPEAPSLEQSRWFSRHLWPSGDELIEMTTNEDVNKENILSLVKLEGDAVSDWAQKYGDIINMPAYNAPIYHLIDWWGWFRDGKGMPVMYNVLYHADTKLPIMSRINPYEDQQFPFAVWNYFPRPGKVLGIGIGRLLTDMNDSLNCIWNQRVDAGRIANSKVFKIRKGSGLKPSDKIYPGKRLFLANPATDVTEMQFGDVKQSSYADAADIWHTADRVVSTGPTARGEQSISRPNASGQLALIDIHEENISIIGDNLRIFWSRAGRLIYSRMKQFAPQKLLPSMPEGPREMFLESLTSDKIVFDLAAADERLNPEAERQKLATAYQMYNEYYDKMMIYAQTIEHPQMPPMMKSVAAQASKAMTAFMRRIGRNLNIKGFEGYLVEVPDATAGPPGVPALPATAGGNVQGPATGLPGGGPQALPPGGSV